VFGEVVSRTRLVSCHRFIPALLGPASDCIRAIVHFRMSDSGEGGGVLDEVLDAVLSRSRLVSCHRFMPAPLGPASDCIRAIDHFRMSHSTEEWALEFIGVLEVLGGVLVTELFCIDTCRVISIDLCPVVYE